MKVVNKNWIFDNLKTPIQENSSVSNIVKKIIEDIKKK